MSGSDNKIGNYKEEYVVLFQWLCLLNEEVDQVLWEPPSGTDDEKGVDVWVTKHGHRTAIQVKKKDHHYSWCLSELAKKIIPGAVFQLKERPLGERADEYHFYTDNSPKGPLQNLCELAGNEDSHSWFRHDFAPKEKKLLQTLGFVDAMHEEARECVRKIKLKQIPEPEFLETVARAWAGNEILGEQLLPKMKTVFKAEVLGKPLHKADLLHLLEVDDYFSSTKPGQSDWDFIRSTTRDFIRYTKSRQKLSHPIYRSEVDELHEMISTDPLPNTILVNGFPGFGKSDILASVAERLQTESWTLLAFSADQGGEMRTKVSANRLSNLGGGKACILIDQWDQLELSGDQRADKKRDAFNYISDCKDAGITIVIGCRSVDAEHDTQLRKILESSETTDPMTMQIGPLSEIQISEVLNDLHIPLMDLSPDMRTLCANPFVLGILKESVGNSDMWRGAADVHALVRKWLETVLERNSLAVLKKLIHLMEKEGGFAISPHLLEPDESIMALLKSGVLIQNPDQTVSPAHQLITDTLLAQEFGTVDTLEQLLSLMGPKEGQGFYHARRIRQAVSIFKSRGEKGITLLDESFNSPQIRLMVKQALLSGLADIQDPTDAHWRLVHKWLKDSREAERIKLLVIRKHPGWTKNFLDQAKQDWDQLNQEQRYETLALIFHASSDLGDEIATALNRWSELDPILLTEPVMTWCFRQAPQLDSDRLFEQRMRWPGLATFLKEPVNQPRWKSLIASNPDRAFRLLRVFLEGLNSRELIHLSRNISGTTFEDFTNRTSELIEVLGGNIWNEIGDWWCRVGNIPLHKLTRGGLGSESPLIWVAEMLIALFAEEIRNPSLTVPELLERFPDPMRDIDGYVMLRVGALGSELSETDADHLVTWFCENPRWAGLYVRRRITGSACELVTGFLKNVSTECSPSAHRTLETMLVHYQDPWDTNMEAGRWRRMKKYGWLSPNNKGHTAFLLLPRLQQELGSEATSRLDELNRKFGEPTNRLRKATPKDTETTQEREYLNKRITEDWLEAFVKEYAKRKQNQQLHPDSGRNGYFPEVSNFCSLARQNPYKYITVAQGLTHRSVNVDPTIYAQVLESIQGTTPPGNSERWQPVPTSELAHIMLSPTYLENDACAWWISRIVEERSEFQWPKAIYTRLEDLVHNHASGNSHNTSESLQDERFNNPGTSALSALAAACQRHPDMQSQGLRLASGIVSSQQTAFVVEAVILAAICYKTDPTTATNVILKGCRDDHVRETSDGMRVLLFLARQEDMHVGSQETCIQWLLSLCSHTDSDTSREAGFLAMHLLYHGLAGMDRVWLAIQSNPNAKSAAAWSISELILDGEHPDWLLELTSKLANDPDSDVHRNLILPLRKEKIGHILNDPKWRDILFHSKITDDFLDAVLDLYDENASLLTISGHILSKAEEFKNRLAAEKDPRWKIRSDARSVENTLTRLIEEATREQHSESLHKTLDHFDAILEIEPTFGLSLLLSNTL